MVLTPQTGRMAGRPTGRFALKRTDFDIGGGEWADPSVVANDIDGRFNMTAAALRSRSCVRFAVLLLALRLARRPGPPSPSCSTPDIPSPASRSRHQGVSVMRGKFNRSQGRVAAGSRQGQGSRIEVVIDATSGDTGHDGLNQKLLGALVSSTRPDSRKSATPSNNGGVHVEGKPVRANG
jgi:polyisoprenoid-binding protein YceI